MNNYDESLLATRYQLTATGTLSLCCIRLLVAFQLEHSDTVNEFVGSHSHLPSVCR